MKNLIVTNNKDVFEKFKERMDVIFLEDENYLDVLYFVRDKIHEGHQLLTHPLSGSVKPNETPFKSVIISKDAEALDTDGLDLIEKAILTANKFQDIKATPNWTERGLIDFRVIDLSLMENVIEKLGHF